MSTSRNNSGTTPTNNSSGRSSRATSTSDRAVGSRSSRTALEQQRIIMDGASESMTNDVSRKDDNGSVDDDSTVWRDSGGRQEELEELFVASSMQNQHQSSMIHGASSRSGILRPPRRRQRKKACCRFWAWVIFLSVAAGVSVAIYGLANKSQSEQFEREFDYQATRILDTATLRLDDFWRQLESMRVSFSAQAQQRGFASSASTCWPFCTISDYDFQVKHHLLMMEDEEGSSTRSVGRGPVLLAVAVDPQQHGAAWEEYSRMMSPRWLLESLQTQTRTFPIPTISTKIYHLQENATSTGVHHHNNNNNNNNTRGSSLHVPYNLSTTQQTLWPVWMTSLPPVVPSTSAAAAAVEVVNYDLMDDGIYRDLIPKENSSHDILLSRPMLRATIESSNIAQVLAYHHQGNTNEEEEEWPHSIVAVPIYDTTTSTKMGAPVALLSLQLAWHSLFEDIWKTTTQKEFEENASMEFTMEDSCTGRSFRYTLVPGTQGMEFQGTGSIDEMRNTPSRIPTLSRDWEQIPPASGNSTTTMCPLHIRLEASRKWYDESMASKEGTGSTAIVYALSSMAIFVFLGIVFWCYDRIMNNSRSGTSLVGKPIGAIKTSVTSTTQDGDEEDDTAAVKAFTIADLHPNVTILHADIANFAGWSSVRETTQVFQLLETLYGAFDTLCSKHKIIKVETAGDSYVAASGIPAVGNEDHALQMARFAKEMMLCMVDVVRSMENALGPGTSELTLRIGLNSGPVVAGNAKEETSRQPRFRIFGERFQLFGETYYTAARMEETGQPDRIQITQETADLLKDAGYENWITRREDQVEVRGQGSVQTYWLELDEAPVSIMRGQPDLPPKPPTSSPPFGQKKKVPGPVARLMSISNRSIGTFGGASLAGTAMDSLIGGTGSPEAKDDRMVNWCADCLLKLLKKIVATRERSESHYELLDLHEIVRDMDYDEVPPRGQLQSNIRTTDSLGRLKSLFNQKSSFVREHPFDEKSVASSSIGGSTIRSLFSPRKRPRGVAHTAPVEPQEPPIVTPTSGKLILEEVAEVINFPQTSSRHRQANDKIVLSTDVIRQVYRFVREVAKLYRSNPYHNFQHASHVLQSLTKFMSRVGTPEGEYSDTLKYTVTAAKASTTPPSFATSLANDPVTHFACAVAALIHGLDHPGVPNSVLEKEGLVIAKKYRHQAMVQQNAVDRAWNLLMQPQFSDLRKCIYQISDELDRFRQVIVNGVMATDMADPELQQLRETRWERAFGEESSSLQDVEDDVDATNRKATLAMEYLLQGAIVSHTLQHWHVYRKWNELQFEESYAMYQSRRSSVDPSLGWYQGQLDYLDTTILPLARKLESCGIFAPNSSDECVSYAQYNRDEWEKQGTEIVQGYLAKYKQP